MNAEVGTCIGLIGLGVRKQVAGCSSSTGWPGDRRRFQYPGQHLAITIARSTLQVSMNLGHEKAPIPIEHKRNVLETSADIMEEGIQVLPADSADQVLLVS